MSSVSSAKDYVAGFQDDQYAAGSSQRSAVSSRTSSAASTCSGTDYGDDSWLENGCTPPWRVWSHSLQDLLDDPTGMDVFMEYLQTERAENVLYLYLACDGLKKQPEQNHVRLVNSMYVKFIRTTEAGLWLLPETRISFDQVFRSSGELRFAEKLDLFKAAQAEAWTVLEEKLYPNFMQSQKYQQYINEQEERYGLNGVSSSPSPESNLISFGSTKSLMAPSRPPTTAPPPLVIPPDWPDGSAGPASGHVRPNSSFYDQSVGGAPAVPPRTFLPNTSPQYAAGLRDADQNSLGTRNPTGQMTSDQIWDSDGAAQASPYAKYAQFCMPSAQESELDSRSQISMARRGVVSGARGTGVVPNLRRDALDYETARTSARLNAGAHTDSFPLPLTEHQRTMRTLDPRSRDPRRNDPLRINPAELASKLNTVIASRRAEERNVQSPAAAPVAAVPQMTSSGRPLQSQVLVEEDESLNVLNRHSERVGEIPTPQSHYSVSPYQPLRQPSYSKASTVGATTGSRQDASWNPPVPFASAGNTQLPHPVAVDNRRPVPTYSCAPAAPPRELSRQFNHMNLRDISSDSGFGVGTSVRDEELYTVLWKRGQAGEFFMTKMTGRNCLRNFKSVLPANMNSGPATRYYFRESLPGTGTVWNEVQNDSDVLPLFEGRITAILEL